MLQEKLEEIGLGKRVNQASPQSASGGFMVQRNRYRPPHSHFKVSISNTRLVNSSHE
jgi:hypothetical protein